MKMLKAKEQYENRMPVRGFQRPVALKARRKVIYPDSDGKPMADNTKQFDWIVKIKENLERIFHDNPDVFIAGDLLWYPEEGNNKIRIAPDAMVVFGRPKGHRGSYRSWEENYIPPQVVFEVLSPGNRRAELDGKFQFYQKYGVEEYYIYDPDRIRLNGWIRTGNILIPIANMDGWTSPLLKILFELASDDLAIYCPDGTRFLSLFESDQIAKANYQRAETESRKVEVERRKAEAEHQRADAECREKERLAAKLRELGIEI
jgi:Uma2 family endonuclease